ncbi:MAG: hypothetical protein QW074_07775 [Candidatus Caldarchaeum sp.]
MRRLQLLIPFIISVALLPLAYAQQQTFYIRVLDCVNGLPIIGASVVIETVGYSFSTVTNSTGYAELRGDAPRAYRYYVSASGYRLRSDEVVFSPGMVYTTCLFRATEGFWRVVADIVEWRGDIHAGGRGWAMLRMKNLEDGVFNVTRLEIWVAGFGKPVAEADIPRGERLERVEKLFNITVAPPQDSPTGRVMAELRFRTIFTYPDGRRIGPLTVQVDLDYVLIQPYRTASVQLIDYWGFHGVPNVTLVLESQLTGAQYTFRANSTGYAVLERVPEGGYLVRAYYTSPYDGETYLVHQRFQILADLAANPAVKCNVAEVHVVVRDLAGRPLEAMVRLGKVAAAASAPADGGEARAVFVNVPWGEYPVKAFWKDVEVYSGRVKVDEPFARPDPGGRLEAVADVGDIILVFRDFYGKKLTANATATLFPEELSASSREEVAFQRLPRGSYSVEVRFYNSLLGEEAVVGRFSYTIPENHGRHEVRLSVFDLIVKMLTADGEPAPVKELLVHSPSAPWKKLFQVIDGKAVISNSTAGVYVFEAEYMGAVVLKGEIRVDGPEVTLTAKVSRFAVNMLTLDGEPLARATASLKLGGQTVSAEVVNGSASFGLLPHGSYRLSVLLDDEEVYSGTVDVNGSLYSLTVQAGRPVVYVLDQNGVPVAQVGVETPGGAAVTGGDGRATLPQAPVKQIPYKLTYRGVPVAEGSLTPGKVQTVRLRLATLTVKVVGELGQPLTSDVDLIRGGRPVARLVGSTLTFDRVPAGVYTLYVSYSTKQVQRQIDLQSDEETTIIIPVAFSFGGAHLSLSDIQLIATPAVAVAVAAVIALVVPRIRRKALSRMRWE